MTLIWLVGVMGVGKSTVGRLAADMLEVPFWDTDAMVEEMAGATIAEIWAERGEQGFRELEAEAVARVALQTGVVATGGGAVLTATNRDLLSDEVVWLTALPESIAARIEPVGRPLLDGGAVADSIGRLLDERVDLYGAVATRVLATDGKDAAQVAGEVATLWPA